MAYTDARLLTNEDLVEDFFKRVLKYDYKNPSILSKIVQAELSMANFDFGYPTLQSHHYRDRRYKDDSTRWHLRRQITSELFSLKRPDRDESLKLGAGGALPASDISCDKQAFIIIGPPASGKSGIANKVADHLVVTRRVSAN
ncbi:hypothetical protein [Fibrella aquatica]|uniref:hypothetical protein n=1 Tax=Fibrella aquatica TaxID=3242487 RepID=UPI003522DBA5